jgi:hypothetical protein
VLIDGEPNVPSALLAPVGGDGRIMKAHLYLSDRLMLQKIGIIP